MSAGETSFASDARPENVPRRRVLLLNPPTWFEQGEPRVFEREAPPLGLLYLAAFLRARSDRFDLSVLDLGPERIGLGELRALLREIKPFAVGISAMTIQLQGALDVARAVRAQRDQARIFLGGAHLSADPGFIERHSANFDHGITGEAEITLLESLLRLDCGQEVPRLQRGLAPLELDDLPFPDRGLVRRARYIRPGSFILSRGCPYECFFCSSPAIAEKVRYRSAGNLLDEIQPILKAARGRVSFADDTFTLNRRLVIELCQEIRRRRMRFRWSCVTRIDRLDEPLLRAMREAGCDTVGFGVESGSARVRREVIQKGDFTNEDISRVVALCRREGLRVNAFFLIGSPSETVQELDATEDMIFRLGLDGVAISLPIPFPGSPLYALAERDGVIDTARIDAFAAGELGKGVTGVYPLYTPGLDREYLIRRMKRIFRRFYLRPGIMLGFLRRDLRHPRDLAEDLGSVLYLLQTGGSRKRPFV